MAVRPRRVFELMNPDVVTLRPDHTLVEAQEILATKSVSGAPVVDESGRVLGVVSQNDLVRKAAHPDTVAQAGQFFSSVEDYADLGTTRVAASSQRVSDVFTPRVYSVNRDTGVAVAANIMRERRIHRLLVIDKGVLVGILSSLDLLRVVEELC
ncbi:MAG: CBS domain-containing protein [Proteobacteria bacterium]|nr:CBS domain-containing protein [Pseudomonadota bacterium]